MNLKKLENYKTLPAEDQALIDQAIAMLDASYAPYSHFNVGAAVRTADGRIFKGCNQENAAYPLCMCGERVALYNAGAEAPDQSVKTLAIVVRHKSKPVKSIATPCGACRQVISEFEQRGKSDIRLLLKSDGPEVVTFDSIKELLPFSFNGDVL